LTALNNRQLITISAESRALLRAAVRRNPGWPAYRTAHELDMSEITTRDQWFDLCDELGIDIAATVAAGPQEAEDAPKPPRAARASARLFDDAHEAATPAPGSLQVVSPQEYARRTAETVAAPVAIAAPQVPQEAAQQLLGMIAALAPKGQLDEDRVRELVKVGCQNEREVFSAVADRLRDDIEALRTREAPAIRIELKRGAEVTPVAGAHHPQFPRLLRALAARQADSYPCNIWLSGPAGSGKTYAAKTAAKALGVAWHYNGALSMPHELLGFIDAAGTYHRTPFREAYENGGVYLFDEVDGSDNSALLALNAALANGRATFPDGQITRHADCYIIATANTWGLGATADYVGRSKIDAAFLSRFPVRLAWDYDEKLEQQISGNAAFAKRVQAARAKARAAGLKVLIDPRASIAGAALIAQGFTADEAAEMTYQANLSAEQRRMIGG
jgi:hypothetical protein